MCCAQAYTALPASPKERPQRGIQILSRVLGVAGARVEARLGSLYRFNHRTQGVNMNAVVVGFRPFKIPRLVGSQFAPVDHTVSEQFMVEDLKKSGLTPDDMLAYVTGIVRIPGQLASYEFPYYSASGTVLTDSTESPTMVRARLKWPEFSKEQRYWQPSGPVLIGKGLPPSIPYIHPLAHKIEVDTLVICEGEKKALSVIKHLGLPAIGIGGCWNWKDPDKSGGVHRWILEFAVHRGYRKILIIPDGDVMRYDICSAYGTFTHALKLCGFDVEIIDCPGKIDDLIQDWFRTGRGVNDSFQSLARIDPTSLVHSPDSLARQYNLSFRINAKGGISVHQITSNIAILMRQHPAFPKIWLNLDNGKIMVGDDEAEPDYTEMHLANYCQHHLGLEKINSQMTQKLIRFLAKENARSPMLEWIKAQVWDGQKRLDTWLHRHWGVVDNAFVQEVSAKWLIGACARMDKPGTKIDWMLIVIGPQATGKTSMPGVVFRGNARPIYGQDNDKDLHMKLHSALCVGFDELDSFGKREASNLKAMITNNEDAFRPPYGASVEIFPRRFTLYGCGNRYEFLQPDTSGHRRYAIVEVDRLVDFVGLAGEVGQLWAEAWDRYCGGEVKYWEVEGASLEAEKYVVSDSREQAVQDKVAFWRSSRPESYTHGGKLYFTLADMLVGLGLEPARGNTSTNREYGEILRKLFGAPKSTTGPRGRGNQKFYIVEFG